MSLSFRLGMILLGLGILLLGLYTQRKSIQGFQDTPAAQAVMGPPAVPPSTPTSPSGPDLGMGSGMTPPAQPALPIPPVMPEPAPPPAQAMIPAPAASAAAPPPASNIPAAALAGAMAPTPPPIPVDDIQTLKSKDSEIRSKFNMITKNKVGADPIFQNLLPSDTMANLHLLYKEVSYYVTNISNFSSAISSASQDDQAVMRQLVYTISDQVNMLYNIYFTLPSTLISTDSIIKSDSAALNSVKDPNVISESVSQVQQLLSHIPSAESKLVSSLNAVMMQVKTITPTSNINLFNNTLNIYLNVVDAVSTNRSASVSDTNTIYLSTAKTDPASASKINTAINANITFLNSTISSVQSIVTAIQPIQNAAIPGIVSNLNARVASMQASLTAMNKQLGSVTAMGSGTMGSGAMGSGKEGFISIGNPYNQPSPSSSQGREFSIGRRAYADEVFAGIKFW